MKREPNEIQHLLREESGLPSTICLAIVVSFQITTIQDLIGKMDKIEQHVNKKLFGETFTQELFIKLKNRAHQLWMRYWDLDHQKGGFLEAHDADEARKSLLSRIRAL